MEEWRELNLEGFESIYEVSNYGRVRSLPREWVSGNGVVRRHNGKILKQQTNDLGYKLISLSSEGKKKTIKVHQLVAIAFLGHRQCGHNLVIDHIDDNPSNNRLDNLQVVTPRYNSYKTQGKYSSNYKGVCFRKDIKKWDAQIRIKGSKIYLGSFNCETEAHLAYQKKLSEL